MGIKSLARRHADRIAGVDSCYGRLLIFGTLATICFAKGMTSCLYEHEIRIFDYSRFAEPFRQQPREHFYLAANRTFLLGVDRRLVEVAMASELGYTPRWAVPQPRPRTHLGGGSIVSEHNGRSPLDSGFRKSYCGLFCL